MHPAMLKRKMDSSCKLITAKEFARKYPEKRLRPKTVFTNGCFDILHRGHVDYLERAASLGAMLIVGLNSDDSIKRIKGDSRPVNTEQDRALVLAALHCVAHVIIFVEDTPLALINTLIPDVLVKGGDWPVNKIIGKETVEAAGGQVLSLDLLPGYSTSNLITRIKNG